MPSTLRSVRTARDRVERARLAYEESILEASEAGHSYSEIGEELGLSKQRIGELVARARRNRPHGETA